MITYDTNGCSGLERLNDRAVGAALRRTLVVLRERAGARLAVVLRAVVVRVDLVRVAAVLLRVVCLLCFLVDAIPIPPCLLL